MGEDNKKHILIIEDEKDLAEMMKEVLTEAGFVVSMAGDGLEGFRSVSEKHPDLVLLDIHLPKMDGLTVLKKIRDYVNGKDLPVIILSNVSDISSVSDAMGGEVYDYLIKTDWELKDVVLKVKKTLNVE